MLIASLERLRAVPRLVDIIHILVHYHLHDLVHSVGVHKLLEEAGVVLGWNGAPELAAKPLPERLRLALEELGPAFVKLGQVLSTRLDLLGPEWIASLDRLHDQATPVPFAAIERQLLEDLGKPVADVFESFDTTPSAAGSVAQVHRAVLKTGESVAVKVRRPGVAASVEADMLLLETLAQWWQEEQPASRRYQPVELVRQLRKSLGREIDFAAEGRSQQRFAESFRDVPQVVIPRVFHDYTREALLVMQWIDGVPGTDPARIDAAGLDRRALAGTHVDTVLKMVLIDGLFHADPHPGNVFFLPGNRIAFIDFGMIGWLSARRRDELLDLLAAMAGRDPEAARDVLFGWTDGRRVSADRFAEDLGRLLHLYEGAELRQVRLGTLLSEIAAVMRDNHLIMPADLALLFKALITAEGFGTRLLPDFRLIEHVTPYVQTLMRQRWEPGRVAQRISGSAGAWSRALLSAPRLLESIAHRFNDDGVAMRFEIREIDTFGDKLERTVNRATIGVVTAALIIGSSILIAASATADSFAMWFLGTTGVVVSFVNSLWLVWSFRRCGEHR